MTSTRTLVAAIVLIDIRWIADVLQIDCVERGRWNSQFVVVRRELAMGERWFLVGEEAIDINLNTTVCCAWPVSAEEKPTM